MNHDEKCETKTRLLLDSGGAEDESEANLLIVYTFGTTKPKNVESPVL